MGALAAKLKGKEPVQHAKLSTVPKFEIAASAANSGIKANI